MTLPSDPQELANFYLCNGSAKTLTSVYDMLAEIQMFQLSEIYPEGTPEFKAAADTIEAIKILVAQKQNIMVFKAREYLE